MSTAQFSIDSLQPRDSGSRHAHAARPRRSGHAHFDAISKGVIDLRDLVYFGALIGFWLAATAVVLDMKKAE